MNTPKLAMGLVVAATCLIVGCSRAPSPPEPPASRPAAPSSVQTPTLALEPHPIKLSDGTTLEAQLGRVAVPEHRGKPDSRTIEVAFLRLPATTGNPGPPIVYLEGGPGIPATTMFTRVPSWQRFLLELRSAGDVIVLDQRGVGLSTPGLECPAAPRPMNALAGERLYELAVEGATACAEHWRAHGHDLSGYNTEQSADDVDAVRRALGAQTVNLVGFSYGTHLALSTIRRHDSRVRRAVLMGPAGPDEMRKLPSQVQAQLRRVSELAASDPAVAKDVPDLLALMTRVLERAETEPLLLEVDDPISKQKVTVPIGRLALEFIAFADFGDTHDLPDWPRLFHSIERGEHRFLKQQIEKRFLRGGTGHAMPAVVRLASGVSAQRQVQIQAELPQCLLSRGLDFPFQSQAFRDAWGVPVLGDEFRLPLRSDVPLLVYTGTLDGNAPPSRGESIVAGFPNGSHVVVDNAGHEDFHQGDVATQIVGFLARGDVPKPGSIARPPLAFTPVW